MAKNILGGFIVVFAVLLFAQNVEATTWTDANDGSGSGLDADLLDGLNSRSFLRSDRGGRLSGSLVISRDLTVDGTITGNGSGLSSLSVSNFSSSNISQWTNDSGYLTGGALTVNYVPSWNGSSLTNSPIYSDGTDVGIGTSSPGYTLDVQGSIYGDSLQLGASMGTLSANWWEFGLDDGVNGTGIDFHSGSTPGDYTARLYRTAGDNGEFMMVNNGSGRLLLGTDNSEDLTIVSGGNVGIGTITPGAPLEIASSAAAMNELVRLTGGFSVNGDGQAITFGDATSYVRLRSVQEGGAQVGFAIDTSSALTERLRVTNDGRVGIGTSSPEYTLDVQGSIYGDSLQLGSSSGTISANWWEFGLDDGATGTGIDFHGGSTSTDYTARIYRTAGDNGILYLVNNGSGRLTLGTDDSEDLTIVSGGSVGIGTTSPSYTLDVQGKIGATELCLAGVCNSSWPSGGGSSVIDGGGTASYLAKWSDADTLTNSILSDSGSNVSISYSGDPGLEIRSSGSGTPYVDFSNDSSTDYDGRIILTENNSLSIQETKVLINEDTIPSSGADGVDDDNDGSTTDNDDQHKTSDAHLYVNSSLDSDEEAAIKGIVGGSQNTYGVWGITTSPGSSDGSAVGVRGDAWSSTVTGGAAFGILAYSHATTGSGRPSAVYGGAYGPYGIAGSGGPTTFSSDIVIDGVQGETYASGSGATGSSGVYGKAHATGIRVFGVEGHVESSANGASGVKGHAEETNSSSQAYGVWGQTDSTGTSSYGVYASGTLGASGSKPAIVYTESQGPTQLYAEESAEIYFSDYGEGQLQNGLARIQIDPLFLETVTIDEQHPMHVFLQSYGDAEMYVKRGEGYFEVVQTSGRDRNAAFSYRVVAKRKYYEDRRLLPTNVGIDVHMRPDLSAEELRLLNERWGLPYTGSNILAFPSSGNF